MTDDEVDAQVDLLRETDAELVEVSRPALDGDNVTIDIHGTAPGGEEVTDVDDFLYEVGSGRVVPELDAQLRGRQGRRHAGVRGGARPSAPARSSFRVLVKEVKEKKLPELTDEWAAESSEFATVEELREDAARRAWAG